MPFFYYDYANPNFIKDMKEEKNQPVELPENAFRELGEGEEYQPVMSPSKNYPEVTLWSVSWGIIMAILFSAAAAYLGLKVGQVFEAAIPIAIIAVGLSNATRRKNALGENVIIQSIGACSGVIVAGAIYAGIFEFSFRWNFGNTVFDTVPKIFCIRDAWQISFS